MSVNKTENDYNIFISARCSKGFLAIFRWKPLEIAKYFIFRDNFFLEKKNDNTLTQSC